MVESMILQKKSRREKQEKITYMIMTKSRKVKFHSKYHTQAFVLYLVRNE